MAKKTKEIVEEEVDVDPAEAKRLRKAAKKAAAEAAAAAEAEEAEERPSLLASAGPAEAKRLRKAAKIAAAEAAAATEADVEQEQPVKKKKKKNSEAEPAEPTEEELAEAKKAAKAAKKAAKAAAAAAAAAAEEEEAEEAPKVKKDKKSKKADKGKEDIAEEPAQKKQKKEPTTDENGDEPPIYRLFVGGIPWSVTQDQVGEEFGKCGEVTDLHLLVDKDTGKSRGIAFVTMADKKGCDAALEYQGKEIAGRKWNVSMASSTGGNGTSGKGKGKGKDGKGKGKGKEKGKHPSAQEKPKNCKSVVVKGLSYEVTQEDLQECFKACGDGPTNVKLFMDRATGKSKGLAFLDFDDTNAVDEAMKLTETNLKGRNFFMDYSTPRE